MASQKLLQVMTTPSKIASALDWKKARGSLLSLNIHQNRIGIVVATHPSFGEQALKIKPIRLQPPTKNNNNVTNETIKELSDIIHRHKVCGVIVSWPLQNDTGRMGAACGRVLHTLENILHESYNSNNNLTCPILTPSRPLCLWDGIHVHNLDVPDEWGRCALYCRTSNKRMHKASEERYHHDENVVAMQVWNDFSKTYWPKVRQQQQHHHHQNKMAITSGSSLIIGSSKLSRRQTSLIQKYNNTEEDQEDNYNGFGGEDDSIKDVIEDPQQSLSLLVY